MELHKIQLRVLYNWPQIVELVEYSSVEEIED